MRHVSHAAEGDHKKTKGRTCVCVCVCEEGGGDPVCIAPPRHPGQGPPSLRYISHMRQLQRAMYIVIAIEGTCGYVWRRFLWESWRDVPC
eukprot:18949-Eustigmatos_ZCMA.PRE.1